MATTIPFRPVLIMHQLANGTVYAAPLAFPQFMCRTVSEEAAISEQETFLQKHLASIPAGKLAEYAFPPATELIHLPVVIPRADLSAHIAIETPLAIPCVVVPFGRAHWVHILPLQHVAYVGPQESLEDKIHSEILRITAARELRGPDYLTLLPADHSELITLSIDVKRSDIDDLGARRVARREQQEQQSQKQARKLLERIGTRLRPSKRPPARHPAMAHRPQEMANLTQLLLAGKRLSIALIGESGAGKSAVFLGTLMQHPEIFRERLIFSTSGAQLVAGQSGFGQLAEQVNQVARAVELLDATLYFDDFGDLFAGRSGGMADLAGLLRPYVAQGRIRLIGEFQPEQVSQFEKSHVGFFAGLHRFVVEPFDAKQTEAVLKAHVAIDRQHSLQRPTLTREAISVLLELCQRYLSYEVFPGKAMKLYEELRANYASHRGDDGLPIAIEAHHVYSAFSLRSGIPMFLLRDDQGMKFAEVVAFFRRRIIGQEEAIKGIAHTLCTIKAHLQPSEKPLANFLFIGPTGVGKTEVAKTLAKFLFASEQRLLRFDMSEYTDPFAAERLIRGTSREEGELTRKVRQQPFCVILLDEIEKAHPAVFDLLLQVCGEGRLSDAQGKTAYFHNAIIIMTSNLGASHRSALRPGFAHAPTAEQTNAMKTHYLESVEQHFRPEFVNRLDRILSFQPLNPSEVGQVARVALQRIRSRSGLHQQQITLRISDQALESIANRGYSPTYGARALRRFLDEELVVPIAEMIAMLGPQAFRMTLAIVFHPHEQPDMLGPFSGALLLSQIRDQLCFTAYQGTKVEERTTGSQLAQISELRRTAGICLATPPIEELRERTEVLIAELASKPKKQAKKMIPPVISEQSLQELSQLRSLGEALQKEFDSLQEAEDFAMVAAAEEEPLDEIFQIAWTTFLRFEKAFVHAVLGQQKMHSLALTIDSQDDPEALRLWLEPFLFAAQERSWMCFIHLYRAGTQSDEDESNIEALPEMIHLETWPKDLPWGPPQTPQWALKQLQKLTSKQLAKHFRAVLLRVRGPLAGAILRYELGFQRWSIRSEGSSKQTQDIHLRLRFADPRYELTPKLLEKISLPARIPKEQLKNYQVVRHFHSDGVRVAKDIDFGPHMRTEYWQHIEHILFSLLGLAIATNQDLLPTDPSRNDDSEDDAEL